MKKTILIAALFMAPVLVQAGEKGSAIPEMEAKYKAAGASKFSAKTGEKMWTQTFVSEDGDKRSCATCHNADITTAGKHKKTGKVIAPMALSAPFVQVEEKDIPRFSKAKKIKKWFKRNCKWTYGRECTAQEKGDFLAFFKSK